MNNRQRLVQQQYLNNEKAVIDRLQQVYKKALQDIDQEIERLMKRFDPETGDLPQSVIYQVQYQRQLRSQVEGHLNRLRSQQYTTVASYLDDCYTDGFVGTMYDMHGQGVPLLMPIDQESMIRAVQLDSKISKGLYTRLGEDINLLKRKITAQVSRGISTGMSYAQVAQQLAGYTRIGFNNAVRIARTEGHRIQTTAAMDAMHGAKEKGADIVKQWDATLDDRTRESHMMVDGQIRELDEPFGNGLMFPGDPSGGAAEVVNCRCAILQRARWALGEDELKTLQDRADYFGLDKTEDFDDFKAKYLKAAESTAPAVEKPSGFVPAKTIEEAIEMAHELGVPYAQFNKMPLEQVNNLLDAVRTLPVDCRPKVLANGKDTSTVTGRPIKRKATTWWGVTYDYRDYPLRTMQLGYDSTDFDGGLIVGLNTTTFRTLDALTQSKVGANARYLSVTGRNWNFNTDGRATAFHEIGHCYGKVRGLPNGWETASARWAEESACDLLKDPDEAFAEAWAAYHLGDDRLPDYIVDIIRGLT